MKKSTLQLVRMGCNFFKYEPCLRYCDIGNHRVRTRFTDIEGRDTVVDFGHSGPWLTIDAQYLNTSGDNPIWRRHPGFIYGVQYGTRYTRAAILSAVNSVSLNHYDNIEIEEV